MLRASNSASHRWWKPRWPGTPLRCCALDTAVDSVARLEESLTTAFSQYPDAATITSFPGLGTVLGARILAEIGDDRTRFATVRGLKAFAGTAPITRASGMKPIVTRRVVRNKRLGQAAYLWAPPMIAHSPAAHAHFAARINRGIGMLHHCLQTQHYGFCSGRVSDASLRALMQ
jgi:transposase